MESIRRTLAIIAMLTMAISANAWPWLSPYAYYMFSRQAAGETPTLPVASAMVLMSTGYQRHRGLSPVLSSETKHLRCQWAAIEKVSKTNKKRIVLMLLGQKNGFYCHHYHPTATT